MNAKSMRTAPTAAVIGAGVAGLVCAATLQQRGWRVEVFDKARGPGGRMASSRLEGTTADIGAPFFGIEGAAAAIMDEWVAAGVAAPWCPAQSHHELFGAWRDTGQPLWVGVPRMSAVTRWYADQLTCHWSQRVRRLWKDDHRGWWLDCGDDVFGPYEQVVCSAPPVQTAELLGLPAAELARPLSSQWVAVFVWHGMSEERQCDPVHWFEQGPVQLAVRDSAKPGRSMNHLVWVAYGQPAWSAEHLDAPPESVSQVFLGALRQHLSIPESAPVTKVHRWRYSRAQGISMPTDRIPAGLHLVGDWTLGNGVEAAVRSAMETADAIQAETDAPIIRHAAG